MAEEIKIVASVQDNASAPLKKVGAGLKDLSSNAKGAGEALKNASSELTGFGTSLPAAGLAIFTVALVKSVEALVEYANSVSNVAEANIKLNQTLATSAASVQGQVEKLNILVAIAQDVTKSDAERSEAIGKLNKDYEGFNKSLTLNNINTAESITLIDKQTQSLIRNAQIKGLENLISKESEKRAEALTQKIGQNLSAFQKFKAGVLAFGSGGAASGVFDAVATSAENTRDSVKESTERTNIYTDALRQLLKQSAASGDLFKEPFVKAGKEAKKSTKDVETLQEALGKFNVQLRDLTNREFFFNSDELKAKVALIQSTILKLNKDFNISPDDTILLRLFGKLETLKPLILKSIDDVVTTAQQRLAERGITVPIKPVIGGISGNENLIPPETLVDLGDALNNQLQSIAANAGTAFADTLANAINGSADFGDFFSGLFKQIGAGLKQLGQYFIKAALEILIVKKALTANPYLAIAAGLALQVLGGLIQNSISKKQAFATGGMVGGVGNRDTVNAMLTPGEFVIRKSAVQRIGVDNLQALNGGGTVQQAIGAGVTAGTQTINGTLVAVIDGKTLRLVLNRADASLSRVG